MYLYLEVLVFYSSTVFNNASFICKDIMLQFLNPTKNINILRTTKKIDKVHQIITYRIIYELDSNFVILILRHVPSSVLLISNKLFVQTTNLKCGSNVILSLYNPRAVMGSPPVNSFNIPSFKTSPCDGS